MAKAGVRLQVSDARSDLFNLLLRLTTEAIREEAGSDFTTI